VAIEHSVEKVVISMFLTILIQIVKFVKIVLMSKTTTIELIRYLGYTCNIGIYCLISVK